jgi:hypothetical protein
MNKQHIPFTIISKHLCELGVQIKLHTYFLSHYVSECVNICLDIHNFINLPSV